MAEHVAHVYVAADGFTGTFEQVVAHEAEHGLTWDSHDPPPHELTAGGNAGDETPAAHIYHSVDGFTGTYEQVLEHEQAHGLTWDSHSPPPDELSGVTDEVDGESPLAHIYHASGTVSEGRRRQRVALRHCSHHPSHSSPHYMAPLICKNERRRRRRRTRRRLTWHRHQRPPHDTDG